MAKMQYVRYHFTLLSGVGMNDTEWRLVCGGRGDHGIGEGYVSHQLY